MYLHISSIEHGLERLLNEPYKELKLWTPSTILGVITTALHEPYKELKLNHDFSALREKFAKLIT